MEAMRAKTHAAATGQTLEADKTSDSLKHVEAVESVEKTNHFSKSITAFSRFQFPVIQDGCAVSRILRAGSQLFLPLKREA